MVIGIKNCGLKTPEAIQAAVQSGADFLGFIIYPNSPRHITIDALPALFALIPSHIQSVCVLVNPEDALLQQLMTTAKPNVLQLHGHEDKARVENIKHQTGLPIIKAVGIEGHNDVVNAKHYESVADYLLLDTKAPTEHGGTGRSFDWQLITHGTFQIPWFLSGGLNAANVVEAVKQTQAQYVDVSSGIESTRGVKDASKIIAFNETVRRITA